MLNEKLLGEDLLALQQERGAVCVSVVVPTHRTSPERRADVQEVKKAIEKAGQLLRYKYPEAKAAPLVARLEELSATVDFNHNLDGIGFYVSPRLKMLVQYPFPVEEKIMADSHFEIRDLLYKINYAAIYYTLLLTEKGARFFEGRLDEIAEVRDQHFPMTFEDDHVYSKPARSASYAGYSHVKTFEKDKSEMETIRLKDFFKKADKRLGAYLEPGIPLIVLGVEKELSLFNKISDHTGHFIDTIKGSYAHVQEKELAARVWPSMRRYLDEGVKERISEFREKIGEGRGVTGIRNIWKYVKEGNALQLLVEKDYRCPGFLERNPQQYHLYLHPPQQPHQVLADAVDDLIEMVLEKKGRVFFTANGMLNDYERMALITRY